MAAFLFAFLLLSTSSWAQSDAEIALNKARQAYLIEDFAQAREFAAEALQTDKQNPDIHLLRGKAQFQLGELDDALQSWREVLKLAPEHEYAKRMVASLEGRLTDADIRLQLIRELINDGLLVSAGTQLQALRVEASLTADQHSASLRLDAELDVRTGDGPAALKSLRELVLRNPESAEEADVRLLFARARVAGGGDSVAIGLAELRAIVDAAADTPQGRAAALDLLSYQLSQGEDVVAEVVEWITANPDHPDVYLARRTLQTSINAFLLASGSLPSPTADSPLNEHDQAALRATGQVLVAFADPTEKSELVTRIIKFLETRYMSNKAWGAATAGLTALSQNELPAPATASIQAAMKRVSEAVATAEHESIVRAIEDGTGTVADMTAWVADNEDHPLRMLARRYIVTAYLMAAVKQGTPRSDAEPGENDRLAIAAAANLLADLKSEDEAQALLTELNQHFQSHYASHGAFSAAISGLQGVLELNLAPSLRFGELQELLRTQQAAAVVELTAAASAGQIRAPAMPDSLTEFLTTARTINTEFPANPAWTAQATFANEISALAQHVPMSIARDAPKPPHVWAIDMALPVVEASADTAAVTTAVNVINAIIEQYAAAAEPTVAALATPIHARLLAVVSQGDPNRQAVILRHVDLLAADAAREFDDNVRTGNRAKNEELTETQQKMIQLLSSLAADKPALSDTVLQKLEQHLAAWRSAGHNDAVAEAYSAIQENLPIGQQRRVTLAAATASFAQVLRNHGRLIENGFSVPDSLDPLAEQALTTCYQLQSATMESDPLFNEVQKLRQAIISHYLALDYETAAEAAVRVKADPVDARLDEAAELQLAILKRRIADRQMARQLRQHGAIENVAITPEYNEAIAAFRAFVTEHPHSLRVHEAIAQINTIARTFEGYKAWTVANAIYRDLAQFAETIDSLKTAAPGEATVAEQATVAAASALHSRASEALSEWHAQQPEDVEPPAVINDEFQAALGAWKAIITDFQQTTAAKAASARIMAIASEYAALDAWDVADSVYASLLDQELPLAAPERLEFARAICQLGKVMPDHARQVLAMIAQGESNEAGAGEFGESLMADVMSAYGWEIAGMNETFADDFAKNGARGFGIAGGMGGGAVSGVQNELSGPGGAMAETALEAGAMIVDGPDFLGTLAIEEQRPDADEPGLSQFRTYERNRRAESDAQLLAAVQQQNSTQAQRVAMLRESGTRFVLQSDAAQQAAVPVPSDAVLSQAELTRQQQVIDATYTALQAVRQKYPNSATARQAREEIMVLLGHWRGITEWNRAAALAQKFLADNPRDLQLPTLRQDIARDFLAWAAKGVQERLSKQEMLEETGRRFDTAREELRAIIAAFPDETAIQHQAQWDIAESFLAQARVITASSPTLARGQFVRAATELQRVAELYHDHPRMESIPDMLWSIADELATRSYFEEAITVWSRLTIRYPTNPLADQAALRIAQTWQNNLSQPLRASEAYLELNFARGGDDAALQDTIYQIAVALKSEQRWVESLHVLQTYVDSFPNHANAGQALTMIGQIHQANEVWEDAIQAYDRVISEYDSGAWTVEAKWAIAECTINLSRWEEAIGAYAQFQQSYPEEARVAEAVRRIEVLKSLARYQQVVDEEGQRKAFDAQYQIGSIVRTELANPVKAIIEYRKVATNWPQSHLADDALFEIGRIYTELGETVAARGALVQVAERYPESPLADDALVLVGTSYVTEADTLANVDREQSLTIANEVAQRDAYQMSQDNRKRQSRRNLDQIEQLKRSGQIEELATKEAQIASQALQFDFANAAVIANWAEQQAEVLTAAQLADRQDKINAALRTAVASFRRAASVTSADRADDALLQMAKIYDERLKDSEAAMATWQEIVKQYSGTTVAEDASWKIAAYYEQHDQHENAIEAYQGFLRNYRRSAKAGPAQAAIAENHEHLGQWVLAMDAYTNYITNFPEGPLVKRAQEQINWIKTYRL